ncbi:MAG: arsenate reductase ArsC [Bacteroidota bacterium]
MVRSVLFLCTGNSCRSQIAEAIVNARHPHWRAFSAGTRPAGFVHPMAVQALKEIGISHQGTCKSVEELPGRDFDLVVTVCDSAAEECPVWPGRAGRHEHRSFVDPAAATGTPQQRMRVFRRVRDEIERAIPGLLEQRES